MLIWLVVYVLVGPVAWIGLTVAGFFAGQRMKRLAESTSQLPANVPRISIAIPAKDEVDGIAECVQHALEQDYPNFEVVVIDDRSTDGTGEALDRIASEVANKPDMSMSGSECGSSSESKPTLKVVHIKELPQGWLGKSHALHVGTRDLDSEYILFVDSDVALAPDAARKAVAIAAEREWDALSIMPTLVAQSTWERTLLPLLAVSWSAVFAISMTNDDSKPDNAVASGGFFLVKRHWYEKVGTHGAVRDQIVEDVMLMRLLKRGGAKVRLQFGQPLARTRMHATLPQIFNGWARIFAGTSQRKIGPMVTILAFLLFCTASVIPALLFGFTSLSWMIAAGVHLAIVLAFVARVYRATGHSGFNALLLPVSVPMTSAVLINAIRVCYSGAVAWRGVNVGVTRK